MGELDWSEGLLSINNEEDRIAVLTILAKNGYTVSIARKKKNGRSFQYFVKYEMIDQEIKEGEP